MNRSVQLSLLALAVACGPRSDADERRPPATHPGSNLTKVSPGVTLEVVDWGGRGPALVFLAGLGNTVHVFDDFAPAFTDRFHVLGITRRGFGASSGALPPTSLDTLVADIKAVLDTLNLESAVLVGHSIAGEEMTRFAELNPDRCAGLVYLDAAYDRMGLPPILARIPGAPVMRPRDSASRSSVRAYVRRVAGVDFPETEITANARFDSTGRYVGDVTPDSVAWRVIAAVRRPPYDRVKCRALAIYAIPESSADILPYYQELSAARRREVDALLGEFASLASASRAVFKSFPQNRTVELARANHYVFLQRPQEVTREMRSFLADD